MTTEKQNPRERLDAMFSTQQKREIADAVQKILRATNHPELPAGEINFSLHANTESSGLVGVGGVCPFEVPPFDAGHHKPEVRYVWWAWHPNYPYWSKSCWGGDTEDKAWEAYAKPMASSMRLYHNKLIREGDGAFTEVFDLPCQEMNVWHEIAAQRRAGGGGAEPVSERVNTRPDSYD